MSAEFFSRDLYSKALLEPVLSGCEVDGLSIVSGYASAAMAFHHLNELKDKGRLVNVDLIYGMVKSDGITRSNHKGFQNLVQKSFKDFFSCSYLVSGEPVHAKVYVWSKGKTPVAAYAGSANYSQIAFLNSIRREVLVQCDPIKAYEFFSSLRKDALNCVETSVEKKVCVGDKRRGETENSREAEPTEGLAENSVTDKESPYYGLEKATISLLTKTGEVPTHSGLNWGQRPEYKREPNQAYFPVRGDLRKSDFFPPRGIYFTVLTDDNQVIQCVRAQDTAKAIHTPYDNSILGKYIRSRANIPLGAKVTRELLERYGRTTVDFYKIDSENYYMDFSVRSKK